MLADPSIIAQSTEVDITDLAISKDVVDNSFNRISLLMVIACFPKFYPISSSKVVDVFVKTMDYLEVKLLDTAGCYRVNFIMRNLNGDIKLFNFIYYIHIN